MKIAIYGDSFATAKKILDTSWFSLLGKQLNCEVDIYGESGSSVYEAYKKIMQTHTPYDVIILLVTEPSRYPVQLKLSELSLPVTGINTIAWLREKVGNLSATDTAILNDVEGWYKASVPEYMADIAELILEKIESLDKTVILFPCFADSFSKTRMEKERISFSLMELVIRQATLLGLEMNHDVVSNENPDVISGHLSPEFNAFFAEAMYNRIQTGAWDWSHYSSVQMLHDKEYYYE